MINSTPGNPIVPGMMIGGKYRMIRPVGEGAMGAVWAARNEATSAEVAIKLLRQPDPELRQRLQREARAGAALKHRHILDVYDAGETAAGEPFLIMQLLQGETLAALLGRRRRLDPPEAARIGRDVARALAAAHALRLVHRDLKPANIFLHQEPGEDEPLVKVLDFGVAKDLSSSDSLRTVVGTVIGSLFYMSPEQASAEPEVDHRSDLWSLGVVLFEMLTGQRPFQGDSKHVLASILQGEIPRVSRYVRRVNGELDDLVARCMCQNREERHGSAAEVAKLLHRLAEAPPDAAAGRASMPSVPDAMVALGAGAPGVAAEAARASTPELARASAPGLTDARAPEITKTLVLPEPEPAARHPRGGAARMDHAVEGGVQAARAALEAEPSGRPSTEPVVQPIATAARSVASAMPTLENKSSTRASRTLSLTAGVAVLVCLLGGGTILALSKRGPQNNAPTETSSTEAPPNAPAPSAKALPTHVLALEAKPPEPPPAPDARASPIEPSAEPSTIEAFTEPTSPDAGPGVTAPATSPLPASTTTGPLDPCAGKTGFLLKNCQIHQSRQRSAETYDDVLRDNPYE